MLQTLLSDIIFATRGDLVSSELITVSEGTETAEVSGTKTLLMNRPLRYVIYDQCYKHISVTTVPISLTVSEKRNSFFQYLNCLAFRNSRHKRGLVKLTPCRSGRRAHGRPRRWCFPCHRGRICPCGPRRR